jgi:large subunit ribosomal protein L10
MLSRVQKENEVAALRDRFGRATSVFVADYRGLDVGSVDALRRELRQKGEGAYEYRVTKNTLLRLAVEGSTAEPLREHFEGPTALAFSFGDPVGLAKVLVDYAKDHEVFELRGGLVEGRPVGQAEIATLATLPGLDELRAKLIGLLQAPATKLAGVLQAPAGQLARLAAARQHQLEEG